jgi:hypothetical protein
MELSWSGVNRLGAEKEQNLSTCELCIMYADHSLCTINAFLFLFWYTISWTNFVVVYIKCNTSKNKILFTRLLQSVT